MRIFAFLAAVAFSSMALAAQPQARPDELRNLDRYLGMWDYQSVTEPVGGDVVRSVGTISVRWTLDDRFLEQDESKPDGSLRRIGMITWDEAANEYRSWIFDTSSAFAETAGKWSEPDQAMAWTGKIKGGLVSSSAEKFTDRNTIVCTCVLRDAQGNVTARITITSKRRK